MEEERSNVVLWQRLLSYINDKDVQTFAATASGMAMRLLLTISTAKGYAVYATNVASAFLNTPIEDEVFVQPP
eukprot:1117797-Amphidinium_carterae.1